MIDSLTGPGFNVRRACRFPGPLSLGYYAWKGRPDPPRTLRRIWLAVEIADVHKASGGTYGSLRVRLAWQPCVPGRPRGSHGC